MKSITSCRILFSDLENCITRVKSIRLLEIRHQQTFESNETTCRMFACMMNTQFSGFSVYPINYRENSEPRIE